MFPVFSTSISFFKPYETIATWKRKTQHNDANIYARSNYKLINKNDLNRTKGEISSLLASLRGNTEIKVKTESLTLSYRFCIGNMFIEVFKKIR